MPYVPQSFIDELNALDPNGPKTTSMHYTLGSDFDEFFGPEALMRHFSGEMTLEERAAEAKRYNEMHAKAWPAIREQLLSSHKQVQDGRAEKLDFNDQNLTLEQLEKYGRQGSGEPISSGRPKVDLREWVKQFD